MEATMNLAQVAHQFLHKPCETSVVENAIERMCDFQRLVVNDEVRTVVGKLKSLPSQPAVYSALKKKLRAERVNSNEVALIAGKDITLSAKILQFVNSAFFGLGRRITSLPDAVNYLGPDMLQKLVATPGVFTTNGAGQHYEISLEALCKHSVLTASIARKILAGDQQRSEDAWASGMLHDIGKLVMVTALPNHLTEAISLASAKHIPDWQAEDELYGVSHAEIGAYLLGLWGLPSLIVEAVARHHKPQPAKDPHLDVPIVVHVSNLLAHAYSAEGSAGPPSIQEDFESLGINDHLPRWREIAQEVACGKEQK
jgi:HD-like signal output (HDOD) protein